MKILLPGLISFSILINACSHRPGQVSDKHVKTDQVRVPATETNQSEVAGDSTNTRPKSTEVGYYDKYEKLPLLVFDTISEIEFNKLRSGKWFAKMKPEYKGNYFSIQTAHAKHELKKYKDYGGNESWSGNELRGYYPGLKLFAVEEYFTSEGLGFGQLFLLDSMTDYRYNIISIGDGSVELPVPSKNNKYLVYYYNWIYDHKKSDIGILKVNSKKNPASYLTEYASYHSEDFAIEKIIWKSDHCFYVKGYEEIYENERWVKKYKYYQATFK